MTFLQEKTYASCVKIINLHLIVESFNQRDYISINKEHMKITISDVNVEGLRVQQTLKIRDTNRAIHYIQQPFFHQIKCEIPMML